MFSQHHGDGSVVLRHAGFLQRGEKQFFFLGVVALVGKAPDEIDDGVEVFRFYGLAQVQLFAHRFHNLQHQKDELMFFFQNTGRVHDDFSP